MKSKRSLRQQPATRLRQKYMLKYGAAVVALGLIIGSAVFLYFYFGSSEDSSAATSTYTSNNVTGFWTDNSSWTGGTAPSATNINSNVEIFGLITLVGDLSYKDGSDKTLTISDTLVIDGNVNMGNKSNIVINSGGVLIITGNFNADNKISIGNGGIVAIGGNMTFPTNNQDTYSQTGGALYVIGTVTGNTTAESTAKNGTQLQTDYQDIYKYVTGENATLPVEFEDVRVESKAGKVTIYWTTATEINNNYFTIEASADGKNYNEIGKELGAGNSNQAIDYSYEYVKPNPQNQFFRVKQTDFDGKFDYSKIVALSRKSISLSSESTPTIISVGPNPFINNFTVNYSVPAEGTVMFQLVNQQGSVVAQQGTESYLGTNSFDFNEQNGVQPGVYFLRILHQNTSSKPIRVVKN